MTSRPIVPAYPATAASDPLALDVSALQQSIVLSPDPVQLAENRNKIWAAREAIRIAQRMVDAVHRSNVAMCAHAGRYSDPGGGGCRTCGGSW